MWLSQSTKLTYFLIFNSRLYFRTLWWYFASAQRTRSVTVRIAVCVPAVSTAHLTQNRFFLRSLSTPPFNTCHPQKPISTLSRTPGHYSYTRTLARRSYRIRTSTVSNLTSTRRRTAKLHRYIYAWTGGVLSGVPALGTGLPCPAGQWVLLRGCCTALWANTSVEVGIVVLCCNTY